MNSENHVPFFQNLSNNRSLHQSDINESATATAALNALSKNPGLGDFILFARDKGFTDQRIFKTFRATHSLMFDHAPNGTVDRKALVSAGLTRITEQEWVISRLGSTTNEGSLTISELWGLLLMNTLELKIDDKGSTLALTNRGIRAFESFANTDTLDALLNNDVVGSFIVYARSLGYTDDYIYATYQNTYALIGDHAPTGYLDHPELVAAGLTDATHRKWLISHLIGEIDYPQLTLIDIWDAQLIEVINITQKLGRSHLALTEEALCQFNFELGIRDNQDLRNVQNGVNNCGNPNSRDNSECGEHNRTKDEPTHLDRQYQPKSELITHIEHKLEMGTLSIDITSGSITFPFKAMSREESREESRDEPQDKSR